jgi:hypothetical protein
MQQWKGRSFLENTSKIMETEVHVGSQVTSDHNIATKNLDSIVAFVIHF